MSFFLLGKGPDDDLRLLGQTAHPTRKAALAELSALTSKPDFPHWDAEVFVLNLDEGTPVLLVRPDTAPMAEEAPVAEEKPAEADHDAELAAVAESLEDEDAVAIESPESEAVLVADAAASEVVDEDWADAIVESLVTEDDAPADLRGALERTAAQLEADGITAPESIGPEEPEVPAEEPPAETPPAEEPPAEEPAIEEPPTEESPVEEPSAEEPPAAEPEAPEPEAAAWPWATQSPEAAAAPEFVLSALEEPGVDEGSLVRAAGDDETMAASRPVILGSYENKPETTGPDAEAADESAADESATEIPAEEPEAEMPAVEEPSAEGAAVEEPQEAAEAAEYAEPETEAELKAAPAEPDFMADLEEIVEPSEAAAVEPSEAAAEEPQDATPVEPQEAAPEAAPQPSSSPEPAGYTLAASAAPADMTCNDCVYVFSCPNRDQRQPASCGSFQWK